MFEKKIVILGGTGFIGRSFKEFYLERETEVLTPSRQQLDLLDRNSCTEYFSHHKPDVVIFSVVNVASVVESIQSFYNVYSNHKQIGRLICFGSGAEYNPSAYTPLMNEEKILHSYPESGYPLAKFVTGKEIEFGAFNNAINLRLFGVYGEYEDFKRRFISNNICRVLSGHEISMNRDMNFDYIYVKDLCFIVDQLITNVSLKERSYNLCSGQSTSLRKLADTIADAIGYQGKIIVKEEGKNPEYSGDPSKFFNEFGAFNFTPHTTAIKNMVTYFKAEFERSEEMKVDG